MNYKLKHLSKFCCKPANQLEFEAVKMAAEIGGVEFKGDWENITRWRYLYFNGDVICLSHKQSEIEITVLDFIAKLRMSEEEARELEDDRVVFSEKKNRCKWSDDGKVLIALNGHKLRLNEDATEVYLVKKD